MTDSRALPNLPNKPGKTNWVEKAGGLPDFIDRIAKHLHSEQGYTVSRAIATAVSQCKKVCATGRTFGGTKPVSAAARARYCKAAAEWEAKKAKSKVTEEKGNALLKRADINALAEQAWGRLESIVFGLGPTQFKHIAEVALAESKLSSKARSQLSASDFVFPKDRRYPIHDLAHARNALARSSGKPEEAKVRTAVYSRYPELKKAQETNALISQIINMVLDDLAVLEATNVRGRLPQNFLSEAGAFDPTKHKRGAKGTSQGGKFVAQGDSGQDVKKVQQAVGANVDGRFGYNTRASVMAYQKKHGLTVDGIVGHQTAAALAGNKNAAKVKTGGLTASDRHAIKKIRVKRPKTKRGGGGVIVEAMDADVKQMNGETVYDPMQYPDMAYDRMHSLLDLSPDVSLPDGTKIVRSGELGKHEVHRKGGKTIHSSRGMAIDAALGASARSTDHNSVGGSKSYMGWYDFKRAHRSTLNESFNHTPGKGFNADFDPRKHPRDAKGQFAKLIQGLKPGESVKLPDGVKVTAEKHKSRVFYRNSGGEGVDGSAPEQGLSATAHSAAISALGNSARSTHKNSVGGTTSYHSYDKAVAADKARTIAAGRRVKKKRASKTS